MEEVDFGSIKRKKIVPESLISLSLNHYWLYLNRLKIFVKHDS